MPSRYVQEILWAEAAVITNVIADGAWSISVKAQ